MDEHWESRTSVSYACGTSLKLIVWQRPCWRVWSSLQGRGSGGTHSTAEHSTAQHLTSTRSRRSDCGWWELCGVGCVVETEGSAVARRTRSYWGILGAGGRRSCARQLCALSLQRGILCCTVAVAVSVSAFASPLDFVTEWPAAETEPDQQAPVRSLLRPKL